MKIILGLTLILITACEQGSEPVKTSDVEATPQTTVIERSRVPVQTQTIKLRAVQNTYRASAVMTAIHDVEILLAVGDTVEGVEKFAGDKVKSGDVIATLVSPDLRFQLQTAKVESEEATRLHAISDELFKKKHIARDRFEETRIQQENARIALAKIRDKVSQLTVKAPFDGTIVYNDLQVGAHRSSFATRAPIRIVDDSVLEGTFSLPVLHKVNVAIDMPITLRTRGMSETAVVTRISPVVDKNTGTVLVYFQIPNTEHRLLSGERVAIEVPLGDASKRLVLPANSLVFEGNNPFVYVPRPATEKEVADELKAAQPKGEDKAEGDEAGVALADDQTPKENPAELRKLLAKIPRAKKVAVAIDQLPTGEYALQPNQEGDAKTLVDGAKVVVIGLYQLADAAKLKVLESL